MNNFLNEYACLLVSHFPHCCTIQAHQRFVDKKVEETCPGSMRSRHAAANATETIAGRIRKAERDFGTCHVQRNQRNAGHCARGICGDMVTPRHPAAGHWHSRPGGTAAVLSGPLSGLKPRAWTLRVRPS